MNIPSAMAAVLYVGAARADADEEQQEQLVSLVTVCGEDMRNSNEGLATALLNVKQIMGESWQPTGEWEQWLTGVLS